MSNRLLANIVQNGTPPIVRFNVEQYHRIREFGILDAHPRTELIDGIIVYKDSRDGHPQLIGAGPRCVLVQKRVVRTLERVLNGLPYHVQQCGPVILNGSTQVLFDICVLKGMPEDYSEQLPRCEDVVLAMEIVDSDQSFEAKDKSILCGETGIPAYWSIHVFQEEVNIWDRPELLPKMKSYRVTPMLSERTHRGMQRVYSRRRMQSISCGLPDGSTISVDVNDLLHPNGLP